MSEFLPGLPRLFKLDATRCQPIDDVFRTEALKFGLVVASADLDFDRQIQIIQCLLDGSLQWQRSSSADINIGFILFTVETMKGDSVAEGPRCKGLEQWKARRLNVLRGNVPAVEGAFVLITIAFAEPE